MDRQKEADLSTPKDQERVEAFRAWHRWAEGLQAVDVNLNPRTVERFLNGTKPPPPRLLEELAMACPDRAIAQQLRDAAATAARESTDA